MTNAPTTRETADHIGEANEKVTADHAELARMLRVRAHIENLKCRPGHHVQFGTPSVVQVPNYWNRDLAADLETLLSEIAALRGERDRLKLAICGGEDVPGAIDAVTGDDCEGFIREERQRHDGLLTQAERQRDEALGLLTDLASWFVAGPTKGTAWVIPSGDLGADDAVNAARAFIANQGAE